MKLLNVPNYSQGGSSDCQAACAAMVMDFWRQRADGGDTERLARLLEAFSFGFTPTSGNPPPAITGLVALAIANKGHTVDFYSTNPDCSGTNGLDQLVKPPYNFTPDEKDEFRDLAKAKITETSSTALTVHTTGMTENEIEGLIDSGKPVVVIVDIKILKEDFPRHDNHAVVITGIDADSVAIHDPADKLPHRIHNRKIFFAAHLRSETDHDAYFVSEGI